MIGDALEITIVGAMIVLVIYPASLLALDSWHERRKRRLRLDRADPRH